MKRFQVFVLATLLIFLPFGVKAIESSWEKVDEGVETIKFEDAEDFEKSLITRVELLNNDPANKESLTTYRYRLSIIEHDDLEEDIDNKTSRTISVNELFATRTDALEYYDNLEIEAPEYKGDYDITDVEIERTIEGESHEIVCQSVDCVNEIDTINQSKDENQTLVSSISRIEEELGETKYFRYKNDDGNDKTFETESEAKTFAESVEMTLSSGWKFIKNVVNSFKVNVSLSGVFDTEDEATAALNQFKDTNTDVEVTKEVTPVRNTDEDVYGEWTRTNIIFDNPVEADTYVSAANGDETDSTITNVKSVSEEVVSRSLKVEDYVNNPFDTEEEAIKAAEKLKETYRDVNYTITPLTLEELTWGDGETVEGDTGGQGSEEFSYNHFDIKVLKTFTYVKDGVSETVTGTMTVNSPVEIKNNGRTTEVKMSSKAQNDETGKYLEYTSLRSQRLEVTNKSIVKITGTVTYTKDGVTTTLPYTISGYLSESQNACGGKGSQRGYDLLFKSVKIVNGKVLIDANIVTKYKVIGTMNEYKTQYVIYTQEVTKGFDYEVEASGNKILFAVDAEAKKILVEEGQKLTYRLDTNVKETVYNLSYEVYSYGLTQYADAKWVIERMVEAKGDGNPDYPNPPQTGNGKGVIITLLSFLTLGLSSIFTKKKEN